MTAQPGVSPRMARWRFALEITASILISAVCAALIWALLFEPRRVERPATQPVATRRAPLPPSTPLPLDGASVKGSPTAKLAIIAYSDFECPYCVRFFRDTLPRLEKEYITSGKVLLAFRHFPLESIHSSALAAAAAAECAGRQEKFWEMHDALFEQPKRFDRPSLERRARAIGLEQQQFRDCLDGPETDRIRAEAAVAKGLGISGTPTFFIGRVQSDGSVKVTHRVPGAQPFEQFQAILDQLLQSAVAASW